VLFGTLPGGINGTVADTKIILSTALKCLCSAIILVHNHPSGSLKPSSNDIKLTKQLVKAASTVEISVLDHLIITFENYFSFADEGLI